MDFDSFLDEVIESMGEYLKWTVDNVQSIAGGTISTSHDGHAVWVPEVD